MADVFISYKRDNRGIAESLARAIEAKGYTTWWDNSLIAGDQFNLAIDRELKRAGCVVTLWTEDALKSRWVVAEAMHAFGRAALISARLDDVELVYPFQIIQAADLRGWNGAQPDHAGVLDILAGVERMIGPARPASSLTTEPSAPAEPRSTLPSMGWRPDTDFFAERFAQAFPGLRRATWFDNPAEIAMRLDKLLEPPLEFAEGIPIWWLRGPANLHIQNYQRLDERLVLLNWEELRVRRIAACPSPSYRRVFVYLEADGMEPTGLYPIVEEVTQRMLREVGYDNEEYAIYNGHHLLRREEYDDGATVIDGKLVDTRGKMELRVRHLTPYNIVIAANGSPFNNSSFDPQMNTLMNDALKGDAEAKAVVAKLVEEMQRLPIAGR